MKHFKFLLFPVLLFLMISAAGSSQTFNRNHLNSVQAQTPLQQAQEAVQQGQIQEAVLLLQNAVSSNPDNITYRFALGELYYRQRAFQRAKDQYEAVLAVHPHNSGAYFDLGMTNKNLGNLSSALHDFQKAVALSSGNSNPAEHYSIVHILQICREQKSYTAAAIRNFTEMLPKNADNARIWETLSELYFLNHQIGKSLTAAEHALRLKPNNTEILLTAAKAAEAAGKYAEAIQDAKKALKLQPENRKTEQILLQSQNLFQAEKIHWLIGAFTVILIFFTAAVIYFFKLTGKKEGAPNPVLESWNQSLETLSDTQEIIEYVSEYFLEFFKMPKGMFLLTNREETQLKCAYTNLKVTAANTLDMNPEMVKKWLRIYEGKPIGATQAYKSAFFLDAFPNAKDVIEKNDMRLILPFSEKTKILAFLLLGGIHKAQFKDQVKEIKKKKETAYQLLQNVTGVLEKSMLYQLSVLDEQTQVYNKRAFKEALIEELKKIEIYQKPCSLLMIDIDHFKKLNDTYGHLEGDTVLRELAQILKQNVRDGIDTVARYGGEEFAVILPTSSLEKAGETAERIRLSVYTHEFSGIPPAVHVSISIGAATYPDHAKSDWELIKVSDQALYQSKKNGRNRVTLALKTEKAEAPSKSSEAGGIQGVGDLPPFHTFKFRFEEEIKQAAERKYKISLGLLQFEKPLSPDRSRRVMPQLASLSQSFMRVIDFFSSDREDRLLIMFSEKNKKETLAVLEKICDRVSKTSFYGVDSSLEVRAGASVYPDDGSDLESLIKKAEFSLASAQLQPFRENNSGS
ncbi:MAG: diguanylate cyclase [Candidatus Eremiobacteraeota bacterium]|nr:diguanylate cyclase [Candidatus Eremiobacteraeota bacterium]MCL5055046.1 diguanylate cyclase [Bacillota bacterium]